MITASQLVAKALPLKTIYPFYTRSWMITTPMAYLPEGLATTYYVCSAMWCPTKRQDREIIWESTELHMVRDEAYDHVLR